MNIETAIKERVFPLFEKGKWNEGYNKLRKISFMLNEENTTEEKRLIYYNLAWVLDELKNRDMSKKYIRLLKNILDEDINYKNTNEEKYLMMMNLYNWVLSDSEKIEDKEKMYLSFKADINYLDQALMAKYDICYLKKDYEGILDICEMIHNYIDTKKINLKEIPCNMLMKLEKVQAKLMNKLKEVDIKLYEHLVESLTFSGNNGFMAYTP